MLSNTDTTGKARRAGPACVALALGMSVLLMSGCAGSLPLGTTPLAREDAAGGTGTKAAPAAPVVVQITYERAQPLLVYADQIRSLQGPELLQEIARFTDLSTPDDQLRLALALAQTRQLYDLVRAQELLQRVLANSGEPARQLHPLARLLAARFAEQRRVEDQLDRQGQQLREAQRRLEQTNDKLEALKEIERSLARPGALPAAPSSTRNRARMAAP